MARGKRSKTRSANSFRGFLWANKAWWITPIVIVMLLLAALVWVSSSGAMPFMYTVF
jgi:hypothetical protein